MMERSAAAAKESLPEPRGTDEEADVNRAFRRHIWEGLAVTTMLFVLALQLVMSARRESATMDEQNHIARGLAYLRTGDTRLNYIHPPLIDAMSALPLALDSHIRLALDSPSWQTSNVDAFAEEFLWKVNDDGPSIVDRARLPIVFLTLLLGVTCYAWARELYGVYAGVATLLLLTFDPNILAHGKLATNDLGLALFATASLYGFWRLLQKPTWQRAMLAGVVLGLALTAKFSALFLLPALALMTAFDYWMNPAETRNKQFLIRTIGLYGAVVLAAGVVVWAVYGFKLGPLNEAGLWFPAPDFINGVRRVIGRVDAGNPSFLFGEFSSKGWWYYFPLAFAIKTPLPSLLLIGVGFVTMISRRAWREAVPTLIPVALYFGISLTSSLNIGYRHLLPILPLLFIFAGQTANLLKRLSPYDSQTSGERVGRVTTASKHAKGNLRLALLVPFLWLAIETTLLFPDYLAYFNLSVGGSKQGYKALADSNLDWGQSLVQLREYMNEESIDSVKMSYFGSAYAEKYGVVYEALPAYPRNMLLVGTNDKMLSNPPAGVYAISATSLQGVFFSNRELYAWFRARKPDAIVGHSMFIYRVQ